jgi:hypothetical protein
MMWIEKLETSIMTSYKMDKDEIQEMIDQSIAKAMDRHNKTASVISACIGAVLLGFYAHGLLTVVNQLNRG